MAASTIFFIISIIALCAAAAAAVYIIRKPFRGSDEANAQQRPEESTPEKGPQFKKHYFAPYITYVIKLIMYIGCCVLFLVYVIKRQTPDLAWLAGVCIAWAIVIVIMAFETRQLIMFRKKKGVYAARRK